MTPFDVFTTVARHLKAQKAKALNANGACVLHAPNGRKCAVGCLISPEAYDPDLEGLDPALLAGALCRSGITPTEEVICLLRNLQSIHDYFPVRRWSTLLGDLAVMWKFSVVNRPWGLAEA